MQTAKLASDEHGEVKKTQSLQSVLSKVRHGLIRSETDVRKLTSNLEKLHKAYLSQQRSHDEYVKKHSITVRDNKHIANETKVLKAEIAHLSEECNRLNADSAHEDAVYERLNTVRAGVKKDIARYQLLVTSLSKQFSNLCVQTDSAQTKLNLAVEAATSNTKQLVALHRDIEELETHLGLIR